MHYTKHRAEKQTFKVYLKLILQEVFFQGMDLFFFPVKSWITRTSNKRKILVGEPEYPNNLFYSGTHIWFIICNLTIFTLNLKPLIFSLMYISMKMNSLEDFEATDTTEDN